MIRPNVYSIFQQHLFPMSLYLCRPRGPDHSFLHASCCLLRQCVTGVPMPAALPSASAWQRLLETHVTAPFEFKCVLGHACGGGRRQVLTRACLRSISVPSMASRYLLVTAGNMARDNQMQISFLDMHAAAAGLALAERRWLHISRANASRYGLAAPPRMRDGELQCGIWQLCSPCSANGRRPGSAWHAKG